MKGSFLLCVIVTTSLVASAQVRVDSLQQIDQMKMNSLQSKIVHLPDTLLSAYQKVASIRTSFNKADSLRTQYQSALSKIHGATIKINNRIDSLGKFNEPTSAVRMSLDSLDQLRHQTQKKFSARLNELKAKTTNKLNALDLPPEIQSIGLKSKIFKILISTL